MAIVRSAPSGQYGEIVLSHVRIIFMRTRHIHVVNIEAQFQLFPNMCVLIDIYYSLNRFPQFLTQMQEHVDEAVTLCQVVGTADAQAINEYFRSAICPILKRRI